MEIITHHFPLPMFKRAIFTDQSVLREWLIYSLGQCVLDCPGSPFCFMSEVFENFVESLDKNDIDQAIEIIDEIQEEHEMLFDDPVFQSIYFSGLIFYKFSYEMFPETALIIFYTDSE